jgi:hypothetical protein
VAARDRLARRATRPRTAVPWQERSRRDLRRGKAEASASLTTGGRRIIMQGADAQSDDVWRWRPDAVSSEEPRTVSSLNPSGGGEALMVRQVRRRSWPSESVWLHRLVPESTTSSNFYFSSPSSTSHRQSYSPREITFRLFFSITKATPRFALIR